MPVILFLIVCVGLLLRFLSRVSLGAGDTSPAVVRVDNLGVGFIILAIVVLVISQPV